MSYTAGIGKIISPKDFDKVDGDDYIMNEDGEKIYFVIKSNQMSMYSQIEAYYM